MHYLHTMVRVKNLDEAMKFWCGKLGLVEVRRRDDEKGKYTNVFLAAPHDVQTAKSTNAPLLELTYNWPDANGKTEEYTGGRNFGHLCYAVENIYDYCAELQRKGIVINRPPKDGRMAFIKSLDGISIELLQIGAALPIQEPWASAPNVGTW